MSMPSSTPSSDGRNAGYQRRLMPGTVLSTNRYQIEKLVASGGMGAVYRAIDTRFKRPCAVKEMLDEFHQESDRVQAIEWFSREATLLWILIILVFHECATFFWRMVSIIW